MAASEPSGVSGADRGSNVSERQLLVVEDIDGLRASLVAVSAKVFGIAEPGQAGTLAEARQWLANRRKVELPLIALVDIGLPDGSGDALIAELALDGNATAVVTTVFEDDGNVMRALGAGAQGYLLKSEDMTVIEERLRGLDRGEVAVSPPIARKLLNHFRNRPVPSTMEEVALTPRESEVLRIIGRGLTIPEAAHALEIGATTVATHVKNIYRKLNIASRAEAAIEATRRGLV